MVRLTRLFLPIVALPVVLALAGCGDDGDEDSGRANARLAAELRTAISVYDEELGEARAAARRIARELVASDLLQSPGSAEVATEAQRLVRGRPVEAVAIILTGGPHAAVGFPDVLADAEVTLRDRGEPLGMVRVATLSPRAYVREVSRLTGLDAAVVDGTRLLASTLPVREAADLPPNGSSADLDLRGEEVHATTVALPGEGERELVLFGPQESNTGR